MDQTEVGFLVAVRIRPLLPHEAVESIPNNASQSNVDAFLFKDTNPRRLVHVLGENTIVFDPNIHKQSKSHHHHHRHHHRHRNKEAYYTFDTVLDESASQQMVFEKTARSLIPQVLRGYNATLFAYGATGCGKTHTITGTPQDPGIIYRTIQELYSAIDACRKDKTVHISISYLEVYNETIHDLLATTNVSASNSSLSTNASSFDNSIFSSSQSSYSISNNSNNSGQGLDLREDDSRVIVAGLSEHTPRDLDDIMKLLIIGNENRTRAPTEANAVSSRSHAVLQIHVRQRDRAVASTGSFTQAVLSIIDLAGSERASVTKNKNERLLEGANINRSLLALGNCINALCSDRNGHIPYRDSKLTRLLKFSLQGNCKVVMIANISPAVQHYDETHNTLKYANRAKNIKTTIQQNTVQIQFDPSQYQKVMDNLLAQIHELKQQNAMLQDQMAERKQDTLVDDTYTAKTVEDSIIKSHFNHIDLSDIENQLKELDIQIDQAYSTLTKFEVTAESNCQIVSHLKSLQQDANTLITQLTSIVLKSSMEDFLQTVTNNIILLSEQAESLTLELNLRQILEEHLSQSIQLIRQSIKEYSKQIQTIQSKHDMTIGAENSALQMVNRLLYKLENPGVNQELLVHNRKMRENIQIDRQYMNYITNQSQLLLQQWLLSLSSQITIFENQKNNQPDSFSHYGDALMKEVGSQSAHVINSVLSNIQMITLNLKNHRHLIFDFLIHFENFKTEMKDHAAQDLVFESDLSRFLRELNLFKKCNKNDDDAVIIAEHESKLKQICSLSDMLQYIIIPDSHISYQSDLSSHLNHEATMQSVELTLKALLPRTVIRESPMTFSSQAPKTPSMDIRSSLYKLRLSTPMTEEVVPSHEAPSASVQQFMQREHILDHGVSFDGMMEHSGHSLHGNHSGLIMRASPARRMNRVQARRSMIPILNSVGGIPHTNAKTNTSLTQTSTQDEISTHNVENKIAETPNPLRRSRRINSRVLEGHKIENPNATVSEQNKPLLIMKMTHEEDKRRILGKYADTRKKSTIKANHHDSEGPLRRSVLSRRRTLAR